MLRDVSSVNADGQTTVRHQSDGLTCNSFGGNVPSVAVIATWILITLWLLALGAPAGVLASRRFGALAGTRIALWFGLASALLVLLLVNFFVPLRSSWAVAIAFFAAGLAVVAAITIAMTPRLRVGLSNTEKRGPFPYWSLIVLVALVLSIIPIAHAAFGAANQWDSGLYHLNAIQYASEYRVIPGLANLHDRLGLTNSQHLITALLSNSGWGIDAFRLQVGFFVFLVTIDLSLRIVDNRPAARSVGSLVLLAGGAAAIAFFLSNTDELVTSPSPDSVALLLTLVGAAYLADGLSTRRTELAATGVLVLACAGSVRTQLWAFTVIAVVLVIVFFRSRASGIRRPKALTLAASLVSGGLLLTTQVRDAIQTGWLLFPLDRFPLPVDWKAFDPAASRLWIISWARTPGAAPDEVMETWTWVGGWLTRATGDWRLERAAHVGVACRGRHTVAFSPTQIDRLSSRLLQPASVDVVADSGNHSVDSLVPIRPRSSLRVGSDRATGSNPRCCSSGCPFDRRGYAGGWSLCSPHPHPGSPGRSCGDRRRDSRGRDRHNIHLCSMDHVRCTHTGADTRSRRLHLADRRGISDAHG